MQKGLCNWKFPVKNSKLRLPIGCYVERMHHASPLEACMGTWLTMSSFNLLHADMMSVQLYLY